MAVEAPAHGQRRGLPHQRHVVDRPVTGAASDALGDVDRVIEIDVIRQPVDLAPADRLMEREAGAHRREHLGLGVELRVAGHAGVGRRHARHRRGFDARMAIAAVETETADVMLMTERDWLAGRDGAIGDVLGPHDDVRERDRSERQHQDRHQHHAGNRVRIGPKNLRHRPLSLASQSGLAPARPFRRGEPPGGRRRVRPRKAHGWPLPPKQPTAGRRVRDGRSGRPHALSRGSSLQLRRHGKVPRPGTEPRHLSRTV